MKLTKTEQLAYVWLQEQGHRPEEIIKNHKLLPDFTCASGRYEVKKLVGRQISFTSHQFQNFQPDDTILVFNSKTLILKFLWSERFQIPFKIHKQCLTLRTLAKESKFSMEHKTVDIYSLSIKKNVLRLPREVLKRLEWTAGSAVDIIPFYQQGFFLVIDKKIMEPELNKVTSELLKEGLEKNNNSKKEEAGT